MAKTRDLSTRPTTTAKQRRRRSAASVLAAGLMVLTAASAEAAAPTAPAASSTVVAEVAAASTTSVVPSSPANGILGPSSVWRQDVSRAPLATNSAAMAANLAGQVQQYYGVAAFNAYKYNTSVVTVPATQKRVDIKWDNCQGKTYTPPQLFTPSRGGHFLQVPMPVDAMPAAASDGQLTVYSPSSDQLWEFWKAVKKADGWHACWGGRLDNVSSSHGFFPDGMGASASGLAVAAGSIRISEAQRGSIDHALSLAIPAPAHWKTFSWPAQRSDGNDTNLSAIPEGTRLRLDPRVDVDALKLHPLAKMVAKSAQKYGFIVTDKSGAVSIQGESGAAMAAATGTQNPWKPIVNGPTYSVMKNFPWDKLQALPQDYGKPGTVASPQCTV